MVPWPYNGTEVLDISIGNNNPLIYLMGDGSGEGFGSKLWREDMEDSKSGKLSLVYQGKYSNFREAKTRYKR